MGPLIMNDNFPYTISMEDYRNDVADYFSRQTLKKRILAACTGFALLVVPFTLSAWLHAYVAWSLFKRDLPWYVDVLAGAATAVINVWLAWLCFVYRLGGASVPLIHQ
jgi:hypothetical protein